MDNVRQRYINRSVPPRTRTQAAATATSSRASTHLAMAVALLPLLLGSAPGSAHAQDQPFAPTRGIHLSAEQAIVYPGTLATKATDARLPDPVTRLLQATATTPTTDARRSPWLYDNAWITDIGTLLYHDDDHDGFHSSLSLTIDADTSSDVADVYVSIDIQRTSGPRERLHTSDNFTIHGNSAYDQYQIDFDLLHDYPVGLYDLYIELHDAYDRSSLDRVGASDFSNLSELPLESADQDNAYDPIPQEPFYPPANDDIHVTEYAGSAGLATTLIMALVLGARVRRRRPH